MNLLMALVYRFHFTAMTNVEENAATMEDTLKFTVDNINNIYDVESYIKMCVL